LLYVCARTLIYRDSGVKGEDAREQLSRDWSTLGHNVESDNEHRSVKVPFEFALKCEELAIALGKHNAQAYEQKARYQLYLHMSPASARESLRELNRLVGFDEVPRSRITMAMTYENERNYKAAADCLWVGCELSRRNMSDLLSLSTATLRVLASNPPSIGDAKGLWSDDSLMGRGFVMRTAREQVEKLLGNLETKVREYVENDGLASTDPERKRVEKLRQYSNQVLMSVEKKLMELQKRAYDWLTGENGMQRIALHLRRLADLVADNEIELKSGFVQRAQEVYEWVCADVLSARSISYGPAIDDPMYLQAREQASLIGRQIRRLLTMQRRTE